MSTLMAVFVIVALLATYTVLGACDSVVKSKRHWGDVFRVKRDGRNIRGFTTSEKQEILDLHNKYRSEEIATDMRIMEWNNDLERLAQGYADRCIWTHSSKASRKNVPNFRYVGENLFAFTDVPTALKVVKDWADEKDFYSYNTGQCASVCGHYTQIVWANSYALGCGIRFCSDIQNLNWRRYGGGYVVVCNYGPGGNIIGRKPYTRGQPACFDCSRDFPYCINGLCSKTQEVVTLSSSRTFHQHSVGYILVAIVIYLWLS